MKRYGKISLLVQSGEFYRVFETESFSIRPAVVHLQRYSSNYKIVAVCYGDFLGCPADNKNWKRCKITGVYYRGDIIYLPRVEKNPTQQAIERSKAWLLQNWDYRTAVNMWYVYAATNNIYPSKTPFAGIAIDGEFSPVPTELYNILGRCERPRFLPDNANPLPEKWDVLRWYEGRRIERMINGEKVEGYLLRGCRIKDNSTQGNE